MKVLMTGASSFTGYHFARALHSRGWSITATFRSKEESYQGIRRSRVEHLKSLCNCIFETSFGGANFCELAAQGWTLLCNHGAEVTNYRSARFSVSEALANNTRNLVQVLESLRAGGTLRVLQTGSVFEGGEGAGSDGLPDLSAYGLSKRLTHETFAFYCRQTGLTLEKFVIPNPFGAWEEGRFTSYLIQSWLRDETPACRTPRYIRDNIHVELLAQAYCRACEAGGLKRSPSGYTESQGQFVQRLAKAMSPRLGRACQYSLCSDHFLEEPYCRINTDPWLPEDWDAEQAWDEMANFYIDSSREHGL